MINSCYFTYSPECFHHLSPIFSLYLTHVFTTLHPWQVVTLLPRRINQAVEPVQPTRNQRWFWIGGSFRIALLWSKPQHITVGPATLGMSHTYKCWFRHPHYSWSFVVCIYNIPPFIYEKSHGLKGNIDKQIYDNGCSSIQWFSQIARYYEKPASGWLWLITSAKRVQAWRIYGWQAHVQ